MVATPQNVKELVLSRTGFLDESGRPVLGLLDPETILLSSDTYLKYNKLFSVMESDPGCPDMVYECPNAGPVPGAPCFYVKTLPKHSQEQVASLRQRLWNHGRIPTLWVITPNSVRVYDAFARPQAEEKTNVDSNVLHELTSINDRLEELAKLHRTNFDNGNFWHSGEGKKIHVDQRVDQALLDDLQATESLLRRDLSPTTAHSLLCLTVFVKYLEDRKILRPSDFADHGPAGEFRELLRSVAGTNSLFQALQERFNGDLFNSANNLSGEFNADHLSIIQRFLSGHSMADYPNTQPRLWPYSFEIIPIELVSSIYELFAHSGDPDIAKARSVHYTKLTLVNMVLSLAMHDIPDSARILDPACGSGVFLVEAFRRLAWGNTKRLNQSQGGMCICRKSGTGLGVSQEGFGP